MSGEKDEGFFLKQLFFAFCAVALIFVGLKVSNNYYSNKQTVKETKSVETPEQREALSVWAEWHSQDNDEQSGTRAYEAREKDLLSQYSQLPHVYGSYNTNIIHAHQTLASDVFSNQNSSNTKFDQFQVSGWRCINKQMRNSYNDIYGFDLGDRTIRYVKLVCYSPTHSFRV